MDMLIKWVRFCLRLGTGVSFFVLICAVSVQVVWRTFIGGSPIWTEELTRFALLYLAGFGTGMALLTGDLVNVDLVSERLPPRLSMVLRLVSTLLIVLFCALLIGPAWRFTTIGAMQTSSAMGLPMDYVHGTVLLLLAGLGIMAVLRVAGMLTGRSDGRPENLIGETE
ncbi:TRAP transporter small permease [Paracoccus sp. (in: a-proteobacteria)]|uniref:TRAP transporter small permease n=1 Tax=Paracoccus sp. TaxID=267 RepID=UPI003A8ABAA0